MKKIMLATVIFTFFVIACGGGSKNDTPGRGELGGACYPNETCNEGFICDTESNTCINDSGKTDTNTNTDTDSADSDLTDTEPTEENDSNSGDDTDDDFSDSQPDDDADTDTAVTGECEIDDSFETSSFSEYYRLRTKSEIDIIAELSNERLVKPDNEYLSMEINLKGTEADYDFTQNTKQDYDVFFSAVSEDDGNLVIAAEKGFHDTLGHLVLVNAIIPNDILEDENLKTDPNGRLNFEAPIVEIFSTEIVGRQENSRLKACIVAVNKSHGDATYDLGKGRTQLCLGDNKNFELREKIKIGIDAELTTNEYEILAFYNTDRTPDDPKYVNSMEDLCSYSCVYKNTVMNEETGECACKEGYKWDSFDFVCKIDQGN